MANNELIPTVIDLNSARNKKLNESWLTMFGGAIEMMLKQMFGGSRNVPDFQTLIKGTPSQVASFGDALAKEKRYMESFMKYGLSDPRSFSSRHELERAIANFERETSIKWPFK